MLHHLIILCIHVMKNDLQEDMLNTFIMATQSQNWGS